MKTRPFISLLATAVALVLTACHDAPPPSAAEPAPILQNHQLRFPAGHSQLALLKTVEALPAVAIEVDLPARLVWNEEKTQRLYAPLAGRVAAIRADLDQKVQPGTVLLSLQSPDFGMAQADAAKAQADLQLADKVLTRQRELFESGIVARKDLEQAEADAGRARAEAARARARTALYGGGADVDQQLALRSGIRGVVVERNVNPGQEVRPDLSGPGVPALFVVSDPTQLWVQIDAKDADIPALRPGATFDLRVPSLPEQRFTGTVMAASDYLDPNSRTIKIRGRVDNPQRLLKAEMLASAHIRREVGGGVMVPASAVLLNGTQHAVYVQVSPGTFEPRAVEVGHEGPAQTVVTQGLKAGETVVMSNGLLLARAFRLAEEAAARGGPAGGATQ